MTVELTVIPGLLILAAELLALAAVGYIVARVALRQTDDRLALAQGLVIGPALWGLAVNFILHVLPGMSGALAGWIVVVAIGAGMAWRRRSDRRLPARTLMGFGLAMAVIFWVSLASRQLLIIPDEITHGTLAATIRAGGWPPRWSWNPDLDLAYHYGMDLLIGLLQPPIGPDRGFTTEILGAYSWTAFVILVMALLMRRGSWAGVLTLTPLLLAPGAWTLVFGEQPWLLRVPIPAGMPAAGLRAALTEVFWPSAELPWPSEQHGVPPNIWKPLFPFGYALALVVLERVAALKSRTWPCAVVLALLTGFLGLVDETVAPVALAVWVAIEVWRLSTTWRVGRISLPATLRAAAGPAFAAALLAGSGGVLTGVLTGSGGGGALALGWPLDPRDRGALVSIATQPGGLGLLNIGTALVAGVACVLAFRNRLVLVLAGASLVFLIGALTLRYEAAPHDVARFDGHARNFALLAFVLALALRLAALPRLRGLGVAAVVIGLVTWPTVAAPARSLGLAIGHGVQIANASSDEPEFGDWYWYMGRYSPEDQVPDELISWIRDHTSVSERILSPAPLAMTLATGRPNAAGFMRFPHARATYGPEYLDSIRYLEPSAIARLQIEYVHAPDTWVATLPDRARRRLADPRLFEPLIRVGTDSLYRVRAAFHGLEARPDQESYERLRMAIPEGSTVYLSPATAPLNIARAAAAMPEAEFVDQGSRSSLSVRELPLSSDIRPEPLGRTVPDFAVVSARLAPAMLPPEWRHPIFRNSEIAVYSLTDTVVSVMEPPPRPFRVEVTDWQTTDGRLAFTATLANLNAEGWTGQDWVVTRADSSPWAFPDSWPIDRTPQWFAGQIAPQSGTLVHRYEYDAKAGELALRDSESRLGSLPSAGDGLGPGVWLLSVRLRDDYRLVALAPVAKISISDGGDTMYEVYQGELGVRPTSGPIESPRGRF